MFSRLIFGFLILVLTACVPKTGEAPPPATLGTLGDTACLSGTSETVKNFFAGSATDQEVSSGWECIESAFNKFNKYVRGHERDKYYATELAEFFEKYFIEKDNYGQPRNHITVKFQNELMKIKQLFVGGSREYVTRVELASTIAMLQNLKKLSLDLNPYMKVYTFHWKPTGNDEDDIRYFEDANLQVQMFSEDISALILQQHDPYTFDDFFALVDEMSGFYNEKWTLVDKIHEYMPLISKIKKTVAGGSENSVYPGEWKSFLLLGARAFVQYARYDYFLSKPSHGGSSVRLGFVEKAAEDLLSAFEQLVREKPNLETRRPGNRVFTEGRITRDELLELLEAVHKVYPKFAYSETLLDESMVVKTVLVGGQKDYWTAQDFSRARLKVPELKNIFEKIMPYYKIYIREWNPARMSDEKAQVYFREAQNSLTEALGEFGSLLETSYSLGNLQRLVKEIARLYPSTVEGASLDQDLDKYWPVVVSIKNIIFEDQNDVITKKNWPNFLSFGARFYTSYLHYQYFLKGHPLDSNESVFSGRYLLDGVFSTVDQVLTVKPSHKIADTEVNRLVGSLQKAEMISAEFTEDTIKKLISAALNSIMNPPQRRTQGIYPNAFDKESLANARFEVSTWLETEIFLRDLFGPANQHNLISAFDLQKRIDEKIIEVQSVPTMYAGLTELKKILSSAIPMIIDDDGRLKISAFMTPLYSVESVSRLNLTRAGSRVLIRSYAADMTRITNYVGVTKDEANKAFDEIKWPFIDMNILDPANTTFIDSRFLEANIFIPRGDGNSYLSFLELNDIMNTIFSGVKLDSQLKPNLLKECWRGPDNPPTTAKVKFHCLRNVYFAQMPIYFNSMPDFLKYWKRDSQCARGDNECRLNVRCENENSFYNLLKGAGYIPNKDTDVQLGDIALMPHITQYLELVMIRFDLNKDGSFNLDEAEKAFPVFQETFKTLAQSYIDDGSIKEKDLVHVFTYVLKYGKVPDTFLEKIKFLQWMKKPRELKQLSTDRGMLAKILGVVADKVASQKQPPGKKPKLFRKFTLNAAPEPEPDLPEDKAKIEQEIYLKHLSEECQNKLQQEAAKKAPPMNMYQNAGGGG